MVTDCEMQDDLNERRSNELRDVSSASFVKRNQCRNMAK